MKLAISHNPESFARNVPACSACTRNVAGRCQEDGQTMILHADANYCPLDKFAGGLARPEGWETIQIERKPSLPLPGDMVAALTNKVGLDRVMQWWTENVTSKPCGCADRRKWLNEMGQKLYRWAGL